MSCRGTQYRGFYLGLLAAAIAWPASAEPPACSDADIGRMLVTGEGLQVIEAAANGLRRDDVLVQLNSHALRGCADLVRALGEARERQLAILLLVQREDAMQSFMLQPRTVVPTAAAAVPATPLPVSTPTPVAIARSNVAPVRDTLAQLLDFGRTLRANLPLLTAQPWVRQAGDLRRAYDQRLTSLPALRVAEPILGYYQTVAEILIYREKAERDQGSARLQPNLTLKYNSGSQVTAWFRRYPFLQASVVAPPEKTTFVGWAESNGRWSPDRAVELLVERALADGEALARQLDTANDR